MLTLEQVTDFVYENLEKVSISKNGTHFHFRCPFCGDSKKSSRKKRGHLHFKSEQDVYGQCFNCGESFNFYYLYAHIENVTVEEAFLKFNRYDKKSILERMSSPKIIQPETPVFNYKDFSYILKDCVSLEDKTDSSILKKYQEKLKNFVNERKIEEKLYIAYTGEYKHRIIIPVWQDNKLIYFQGRRTNDKVEPKYLNPSSDKELIILNIDKFERDKYIIIVEGILDAFSVGNQATTVLGKEINEEFLNTVKEKTDKGVIFALDNDKDGIKQMENCIKKFGADENTRYFVFPNKYKKFKDLNNFYINNTEITNMYQFIYDNSYSNKNRSLIQLKMRNGGII